MRSRRHRILLVALAAIASLRFASAAPRRTPVERANALLAQMTQAEKIAFAADGEAGLPRLGIPALALSDGPNGVRLRPPNTAFPNAHVVAASWDRALAGRYGTAIGAEAAGKGFNVLFGPTVNILRTPKWGRSPETLGEDPFLAGQIVAAEIAGIQSQHVVSQVKHFAANNQEIQRVGNVFGGLTPAINVLVSERALQEIYFPAFKSAVREGGAMSVMCSYPRINGVYACQNPSTLGTLKDAWGFAGFVGPDAILAVRDTVAAALAGTDNFAIGTIGIPAPQALQQIPPDRLDDMVRRILTAMFTVGLFDHPNTGGPGVVVSTPEHQALATEVAASGAVLLKNANHALPLGADVASIALIGYDAGRATQNMEGGSGAVVGVPVVTPLAAITARAGQGVAVTHTPGTLGVVPLPSVPADVLSPSSGTGPGLFGTYYATTDFTGSALGAFVSPTLDFNTALAGNVRSARWTGTLTPPVTGTYRFSLGHSGVARLFVDGRLIARGDVEWYDGAAIGLPGAPPNSAQGLAVLTVGIPVSVTVEQSIGSSVTGSPLHFGWQPPGPPMVAEAVAAARAADVAVVFVNDVAGEGMDRTSLVLPGDQDLLIGAVAAANPRTVVVLHTSGPVLMPWLAQVAAVIEAWYPGEKTGDALAALLFGDVAPSGRLPMTFPASEAQGPATTPAQYPGVDGDVHYDEGIFVGYRFYDQFGQEPLFPFGFGLSYTDFKLDRLRITRRHGGKVHVSVRVTNTGTRDGAAVVQTYVGFPAAADEPPNQLKGFAKVFLRRGQRVRVRTTLDRGSFSAWSAVDGAWVVHPGAYQLRVGTSSRDLPLQATVVVK